MKRVRYSSGFKIVIAILQQILMIVLVICIAVIGISYDKNMLNFDVYRQQDFVDSDLYQEEFETEMTNLLHFLRIRDNFETDGKYIQNKVIDIVDYADNNLISGMVTEDGIGYTIEEILQWSTQGYELANLQVNTYNEYDEAGIPTGQGKTTTTYFYPAKSTEKVVEDDTDSDSAVLKGLEESMSLEAEAQATVEEIKAEIITKENIDSNITVFKEEIDFKEEVSQGEWIIESQEWVRGVKEEIISVDGHLIADLSNYYEVAYMEKLYESLIITLKSLPEEFESYKKMFNQYREKNTNMFYWYKNEATGEIFTNAEKMEGISYKEACEKAEKMGSYIYYDSQTLALESSNKSMINPFFGETNGNNYYDGKLYKVVMGVDVLFPIQDQFFDAQKQYNTYHPWALFCLFASVACVIGILICFIYLSVGAGRRNEDDTIHLNFFDKIKTEIGFIVLLAMEIVAALCIKKLSWHLYGDFVTILLLICAAVFCSHMVFMVGYLSLIRRIRAGTLFVDSMCYSVLGGLKKIVHKRKVTTKIAIGYGLYMLINILLFCCVFYYWNWISIGLLFLLFGMVGAIVIRDAIQRKYIAEGVEKIAEGDLEYQMDLTILTGDNKFMANAVNNIGDGLHKAVGASVKNERLKTDLITNVSHDIKTPLTSIINYVKLIKREELPDEKIRAYVEILDMKSQRLKQLTEDLVEASKVSSGNITLYLERINFVELINQTCGEFSEKFENKKLQLIANLPSDPVIIEVDGRRIWRIIENLYSNVEKYAMENTRVYVDLLIEEERACFSIKNISEQALNIQAEELTERFIRGDVSRSTEGSGLGLSIAQSLTKLQNGEFEIYLDGDLFRVTVSFPLAPARGKIEEVAVET